jgi:NAD-dependent DNA ligase
MDKIQRIKELVNQLNIYRHEYYNLNRPSVSDMVLIIPYKRQYIGIYQKS